MSRADFSRPQCAGEPDERDYFAVHLFQDVTANLSRNCSLQDKAEYAVNAAAAQIRALERKALKRQEPLTAGQR